MLKQNLEEPSQFAVVF